jgi:hypothetical protein
MTTKFSQTIYCPFHFLKVSIVIYDEDWTNHCEIRKGSFRRDIINQAFHFLVAISSGIEDEVVVD